MSSRHLDHHREARIAKLAIHFPAAGLSRLQRDFLFFRTNGELFLSHLHSF
jgi:hypothetical protein